MTTTTTTTTRSTMTTTTNPAGVAAIAALAHRLDVALSRMPYGGSASFCRSGFRLGSELDSGRSLELVVVDYLDTMAGNLDRLAAVLRSHADHVEELELELKRHRTAVRGLAALRELVAEQVAP